MSDQGERSTRGSIVTMPERTDSAELERSSLLDGHLCPTDLEWCVDVGDGLKALSTLDLWIALSNGELDAATPVWKLGRERWLPAAEVPDLACAISVQSQTHDLKRAAEAASEIVVPCEPVSVAPVETFVVPPTRTKRSYATTGAFASSLAVVALVLTGVWQPTRTPRPTEAVAISGRAVVEDVGLRQRLWEAEVIEGRDESGPQKKKRAGHAVKKRASGFLRALRATERRSDSRRSRH